MSNILYTDRVYTCHYKENVLSMHFNLKIVCMWNKFISIRIGWGMNNLNIHCSIKLINATILLWKPRSNCYNIRYPCRVNVTSKYHLHSNYFICRKYLWNRTEWWISDEEKLLINYFQCHCQMLITNCLLHKFDCLSLHHDVLSV